MLIFVPFYFSFLVQMMSLHGEMLQKERSAVYKEFCITKTGSVLLCTVRTISIVYYCRINITVFRM